jgi:predicted GH43/DUF377 family glycosyl hydrolase
MHNSEGRDILHRWEGNPVITTDALNFRCASIFNAGVVFVGGEVLLLLTIQSLEGAYAIYPARSGDGKNFIVDDQPILAPITNGPDAVYEKLGILDARITNFSGEYFICYDALSLHGYRLGLAKTTDFDTIERIGLISEPDTKSGVIFPDKINGHYARLGRPWEGGSIWISYSNDLLYWGNSDIVMTPRSGYWDCDRIGTATPPIGTESGWLIIYYGVKRTSAGPLFRLGAAVLDKKNPGHVLGRTNVPILSPREDYERIGDMPNLVYSCGAILKPDRTLHLYYGASSSCIALGTTTVDELLSVCLNNTRFQ